MSRLADINRGVLLGQLLSGLESAQQNIRGAQRGQQFLSQQTRDNIKTALNLLAGAEQEGWSINKLKGPR